MHAQDINIALLIQSLERVDEEGQLIPFDARRRADRLLEGDQVGSPSQGISARSHYLRDVVERSAPNLWKLASRPQALSAPLRWGALGLSFILGFGVQGLGAEGAFHLLSPALIGLILWNVVSLSMLSLISRRTRRSRGARGHDSRRSLLKTSERSSSLSRLVGSLNAWLYQRWLRRALREQRDAVIQLKAARVYSESANQLFAPLIAGEVRRALHLCAALFALGVLGGAYWEGIARAYQVTAASTFLSVQSVSSLAEWLLLPSRLIWGELPALVPTSAPLVTPKSLSAQITHGPAAPWIHRYAFSVMVWVVAPRLLLALRETFTLWRARLSLPARLGWLESVPTLNIALAAHTNIGKTSLARTLLRRDVGEVRDAEHVTLARASYFLVSSSTVRLRLWDTPGFGDPRPIATLAAHCHTLLDQSLDAGEASKSERRPPLSQLLREVRRLESKRESQRASQRNPLSELDHEALRALEEESDLILYLVPALPSPAQLEQTRAEWSMLALLNRPVLVMINRVTEAYVATSVRPDDAERPGAEPGQEVGDSVSLDSYQALALKCADRWREELREMNRALGRGPERFEVYVLDAFQRTYQEERGFYEALTRLLDPNQRELAESALSEWESSQLSAHASISRCVTRCIESLSELSINLKNRRRGARKDAEDELQLRASELIHQARERLLDLIGLEGVARAEGARFALEVMVSLGDRSERRKWGAIIGGMLSGIATGLGADLMAGGLSLGGGMIVGGFLGAIGGAGAVEGYDYVTQRDLQVSLSDEALRAGLRGLILFLLSASAHGRAQGAFIEQSDADQAQTNESAPHSLIADRCREVMSSLEARYAQRLEIRLASLRLSSEPNKSEKLTPEESSALLLELFTEIIQRGLRSL